MDDHHKLDTFFIGFIQRWASRVHFWLESSQVKSQVTWLDLTWKFFEEKTTWLDSTWNFQIVVWTWLDLTWNFQRTTGTWLGSKSRWLAHLCLKDICDVSKHHKLFCEGIKRMFTKNMSTNDTYLKSYKKGLILTNW